mmetsp:Transcript_26256/g.84796  ORF Transcript_26256/g.84796 Transcript_26256/m.84796 type:complete len:282 (+) Transcript_26256:289-1134(+)
MDWARAAASCIRPSSCRRSRCRCSQARVTDASFCARWRARLAAALSVASSWPGGHGAGSAATTLAGPGPGPSSACLRRLSRSACARCLRRCSLCRSASRAWAAARSCARRRASAMPGDSSLEASPGRWRASCSIWATAARSAALPPRDALASFHAVRPPRSRRPAKAPASSSRRTHAGCTLSAANIKAVMPPPSAVSTLGPWARSCSRHLGWRVVTARMSGVMPFSGHVTSTHAPACSSRCTQAQAPDPTAAIRAVIPISPRTSSPAPYCSSTSTHSTPAS